MLQQKINEDLRMAMKGGVDFEVGVLRMMSAALHNREIEKKGSGQAPILTDEEIIEVLGREAKKRKESAAAYLKGNRNDLALKEKKELEIITRYLPEQLSAGEIEKIVSEVLNQLGAKGPGDFGRVMSETMKKLKGRADAVAVGEIIKKKLGER